MWRFTNREQRRHVLAATPFVHLRSSKVKTLIKELEVNKTMDPASKKVYPLLDWPICLLVRIQGWPTNPKITLQLLRINSISTDAQTKVLPCSTAYCNFLLLKISCLIWNKKYSKFLFLDPISYRIKFWFIIIDL